MDQTAPIPAHLPDRLTIAVWLWNWAIERRSDEGFESLEAAFKELVERGFNTVRVDALGSWALDPDGNRRGDVLVGNAMEPGYCNRSGSFTADGGFTIDAYEELMDLFRLAEEYDVYVALTTWEYQSGHSIGFLADREVRNEILGVPEKDRPTYLAQQWDYVLNELERNGFKDRIAYVELHNEVRTINHNATPWEMKPKLEEGIAFLHERHPDILVTSDHVVDGTSTKDEAGGGFDWNTADEFMETIPENTQVLDHHLYSASAGGVQGEFFERVGVHIGSESDEEMRRLEPENELFQWLLEPDCPSWTEFSTHFTDEWFEQWHPIFYLFENMDVQRYDAWMLRNYPSCEDRMRGFWKNYIQALSAEARQRGIPLVVDEGYLLYPPTHSAFETSAVVKENFEFIVEQMLGADYWGIMISTYTYPGHALWEDEAPWLAEINDRILSDG